MVSNSQAGITNHEKPFKTTKAKRDHIRVIFIIISYLHNYLNISTNNNHIIVLYSSII